MFTKILLIVLISAVLVQAQDVGGKIHLNAEQKQGFLATVMGHLKQKQHDHPKRSAEDALTDAYHEVMDAVKERLEERLDEGLDFSCIPFSGGF